MKHRARVAILISGGGSNMRALIASMIADDHPAEPALVVSDNADAAGLAKASGMGVETAVVDRASFGSERAAFDAALDARLDAHGIDIIACAGFMRILGEDFVARRLGTVLNIHPSLLPLYPGLKTHERALSDGALMHGCTVHEVTADLDAGPVLGQAIVAVEPDDTPDMLAARVLRREHMLYPMVLRRFAADPVAARRNRFLIWPDADYSGATRI